MNQEMIIALCSKVEILNSLNYNAKDIPTFKKIKMQKIRRRKKIRLQNYDYSENGYYFVTICSNSRRSIFGKYEPPVGSGLASDSVYNVSSAAQIKLTTIGKIIEQQWKSIPIHFDHIELDEYVIMPNHIHGIIVIKGAGNVTDGVQQKRVGASPTPTLSKVVGAFKSRAAVDVLRYIKQNNLNISGKIWQQSFYDHVIRNDRTLDGVREYIAGNPVNWELDIENF